MMDMDGRLYYCYEEDELLDAVEKAMGNRGSSTLACLLEEMRQFFVYVAPNEDIDSQSVVFCKTQDAIREETQEAIKQSVESGNDDDGKNPHTAEEVLAEFDPVKQRDMRIAELEEELERVKMVVELKEAYAKEAEYWRGQTNAYESGYRALLETIGNIADKRETTSSED